MRLSPPQHLEQPLEGKDTPPAQALPQHAAKYKQEVTRWGRVERGGGAESWRLFPEKQRESWVSPASL